MMVTMHRDDVLKVRIESELTTLRLWPLMKLLSRSADELYRLDCDGILSSDSESSSRVSCFLCGIFVHNVKGVKSGMKFIFASTEMCSPNMQSAAFKLVCH